MPRSVTNEPLSTCPECDAQVFAVPGGHPPEKMRHEDGCSLSTRKPCAWCGGPPKPKVPPSAKVCQDKCRAARWKWTTRYGKSGPGPRSGRKARSGAQISFGKATGLLAAWIGGDPVKASRTAELILRGALSEKQAARLREREA